MKQDEMEIIRAVSVDLGDGLTFMLSYQYHTEIDPATGRNDRSKSRYRMIGRVDTKENFDKLYLETRSDANRVNPWKWPDDPSWDGRILYMHDSTNAGFSNWLRLKAMKALPWEAYARVVTGWKKDPKKAAEDRRRKVKMPVEEVYSAYTPSAVYETEGYSCTDGSTVSILDRDALKSKAGQTLALEIHMKISGPQPSGKAQPQPQVVLAAE